MTDEREFTAYHEAAHCIVSHVLGCRPIKITIDRASLVEHANRADPKAWALVLYSGSAAATRVGGPAGLRGSRDLEMLAEVTSQLPTEVAEQIPSLARALVDKHWAEIEELVRVVLLRGTLQGADLRRELVRICGEGIRRHVPLGLDD
jgi:hypothetical protein